MAGALKRVGDVVSKHSNLLGGAMTLIAGVLSILLVFVNNDRTVAENSAEQAKTELAAVEEELATVRRTSESRARQVKDLESQVSEQAERIKEFEAQVKNQDVEPPTAADEPKVRKAGELTLAADGLVADLNAAPDDPVWGTDKGLSGHEPDEFTYTSDYLFFNAAGIYEPDAPATYTACATGTAYGDGEAADPATINGNGLCIKLKSGRLATLFIVDSSPDEVTVELKVWEQA